MDNTTWHRLAEGGPDLILAVDYAVTGRREAGFTELVPQLGSTAEIWQTLPPPAGSETGMAGKDYVARWLETVRESGRTVSAVLGYCVSGAFAGAIADGVAQWQDQAPRVVLFDPSPANTWTITMFGYFKMLEPLAGSLTERELVEAHQNGIRVATECEKDMERFRTEIVETYRSVGTEAFARLGLNEGIGEEMVAAFAKYIAYLTACGELEGDADLSRTVVLNSSAPREPHGPVLREQKFDVEHEDLLRTPEVAAAVVEALTA